MVHPEAARPKERDDPTRGEREREIKEKKEKIRCSLRCKNLFESRAVPISVLRDYVLGCVKKP